MKALYLSCPMCTGLDHQILFPSFYKKVASAFQNIVICRQCGLVFRNPQVPDENVMRYSPASWGDGRIFAERMQNNADYLKGRVSLAKDDYILDVGTGPGWLLSAVLKRFPDAKGIGIEPIPEVAKMAKANCARAIVLPSTLDEASFPKEMFSLILVCGVDYLFTDHRSAMDLLWSWLKKDGHLYIERNVFVEQEAYTGHDILGLADLFGSNQLMSTWFAREQFKAYIDCNFEVLDVRRYDQDVTPRGLRNTLDGLFCRKRPIKREYDRRSWYAENLSRIELLSKNTLPHRGLPASAARSGLLGHLGTLARKVMKGGA